VPGPVMTVSMSDKLLHVFLASGKEVCNSLSFSDFPWISSLDVSTIKAFVNGILVDNDVTNTLHQERISNGLIFPPLPMQGAEPVTYIINNVCNDNGVPLGDTDDISCLRRLTIGTIATTDPCAYRSIRDAAFIEHHLRMYKVNRHPSSSMHVFMKCLRESCDLVISIAADINMDVFIASVKSVYEELGCWNHQVKGKLVLAYVKSRWIRWPQCTESEEED